MGWNEKIKWRGDIQLLTDFLERFYGGVSRELIVLKVEPINWSEDHSGFSEKRQFQIIYRAQLDDFTERKPR